jgi:hypothetical protein
VEGVFCRGAGRRHPLSRPQRGVHEAGVAVSHLVVVRDDDRRGRGIARRAEQKMGGERPDDGRTVIRRR